MATVEPYTLCDTFVSESLLHTITTHKQKELLMEGALFVYIYLICLEPRSVIATPSLQRGQSSCVYVGTSRLSKACTFS